MNFDHKPILGMIHLAGGNPVLRALEEIKIYEEEGVDGIIIENYHGSVKDILELLKVMPETGLLVGINILPNEWHEAIPLVDTFNLDFVQLDWVSGIYAGHHSFEIENYNKVRKNFPIVKVLGGVWPKYYNPIYGSILENDLKDGIERSDAIVVTGSGTGKVTPLDKIKKFRNIIGEHPLIIGAGLDVDNVYEQLIHADGAIVGSCFKPYGRTQEKIDPKRVREFMVEVNRARIHHV